MSYKTRHTPGLRPQEFLNDVRNWADIEDYRKQRPSSFDHPHMRDRLTLSIFAAGDEARREDHFGLGAYLIANGPCVIDAGLIVPDGLSKTRQSRIEGALKYDPFKTIRGALDWQVVTRSAFFDPRDSAFTRIALLGNATVVGTEFLWVFSLCADHCDRHPRGEVRTWKLWLPGWARCARTVESSAGIRTGPISAPCRGVLLLVRVRVVQEGQSPLRRLGFEPKVPGRGTPHRRHLRRRA
jgi:hypothetical protein